MLQPDHIQIGYSILNINYAYYHNIPSYSAFLMKNYIVCVCLFMLKYN